MDIMFNYDIRRGKNNKQLRLDKELPELQFSVDVIKNGKTFHEMVLFSYEQYMRKYNRKGIAKQFLHVLYAKAIQN